MKTYLAYPVRALTLIAALAMLAGCSKSTTSTDASTDMTGSAASAAPATGGSLLDQVGGMAGANQLADAFASNLAANSTLSAVLNPDAINAAKQGLVNEVAKTSNVAEPYPGASLLTALSGKVTTPDGANAVTDAVSKAADSVNLNSTAKTSLMAMMAPITKSLAG